MAKQEKSILCVNKMSWVSEFVSNALKSIGLMDIGSLQPYSWLEFEPLFAKQYVEKLEELMQKAEKQHISFKELAPLWPTTSGLRCQLFFLFTILKAARIGKERRMKICNSFFAMLQERAVDDVHGKVSNLTRTKKEVKLLVERIKPQKGTAEIAKIFGKISNIAYNLIAGLYLDIYLDYAMENEGPYDVSEIYGKGHTLVIKKYLGLQSAVWPEVKVPFNNLVIYCVYQDVKFSCDMASCHSIYEGNVIENLVAFALEVDGKIVMNKSEIENVVSLLEPICVEQWTYLKSLSLNEQKKRGLLIKLYGMRRLFKKGGMDWHPTKEMLHAVEKPLKESYFWNVPKEKKEAFWEKIYNPKIDFYPAS